MKKERIQTEEKHWKIKRIKNEEYRKSQITTMNIFNFTFHIKNYIFLENRVWKNVGYTNAFYLQFLCVIGYLKNSNNTPKVNIHKYNIIIIQ